jgi:transcription antitermination factor NusG
MPHYVLVTAPQLEFQAEAAVRKMGYSVVIPYEERELRKRIGRDRRTGDFRKFVLLRRYLIVDLPNTDAVGALVYRMSLAPRRLVTGYLGASARPCPVPVACVDYLTSISGKRILLPGQLRTLQVGDVARMINGTGTEGAITKVKRDQVQMLQNWFGTMREVTVSAKSLQKIEPTLDRENELRKVA